MIKAKSICRMMLLSIVAAISLVAYSPAADSSANRSGSYARGEKAMVVSAEIHASRIGRDVMKRGGTAVDAAVATGFALAVTLPQAGNIGGGGFMMVYPGEEGQPVCIDYRETAPAAATEDMFKNEYSTHSRRASGTPGTVRGFALAHRRYGKLPWRQLVLPAADLAENGFQLSARVAGMANEVLGEIASSDDPRFDEFVRVYGKPGGGRWKAGDRMVLPDLAATLRLIAEAGPEAFYNGPIADQIVAEMRRGKGLITKNDLRRYRPIIREPIRGTYGQYEILAPPPPSSGGICLIEMLNILETFELNKHDRYGARNMHLIAETMRRAYCDRARYLGDPAFVGFPCRLTSKAYARRLAAEIDPNAATPSADLAEDIELAAESPDTTHFSIIGPGGMAVSNTYTLQSSWGSRIVVHGAGFLLNDEMSDFNQVAGHTDRSGAIGTEANLVAPNKRMLSSQTPILVLKQGRVVLATGSPGGRTIINTVLGVVLNVIEFSMDLPEAVAAPRLHHQWFPDQLEFEGVEEEVHSAAVSSLRAMGHSVIMTRYRGRQGSANSIVAEQPKGTLHGVGDWRRGGHACGY